jgi:hypothetical protein
MAVMACAKKELPELPLSMIPQPTETDIESVVFIVGDMGLALWDQSPMVRSLARDVEEWSRRLPRDSSVSVLFLGDNIYPAGLHEPHEREWAQDSAHLEAQVMILAGPNARAKQAFGIFIAGNHDWGHKFGAGGERRIRNQEEFLDRRRSRGIHVRFLPPDATPGPGIVDVGSHLRMLLLDTAWWLLSADREEKMRTMVRLQTAMTGVRGRNIVIAAHHPMRSASAHGGLTSFWATVGVKWLLSKSGASLQDLNSLPYRDLQNQLTAVFRVTGPPLLFAGGHDHSLQVLRGLNDEEPRFMVVSGAGSKLSRVGHTEGMLYRSLEPGYMLLVTRKDGGAEIFVYSAPPDYLSCAEGPPSFQEQCVNAGAGEFRAKFGVTLK